MQGVLSEPDVQRGFPAVEPRTIVLWPYGLRDEAHARLAGENVVCAASGARQGGARRGRGLKSRPKCIEEIRRYHGGCVFAQDLVGALFRRRADEITQLELAEFGGTTKPTFNLCCDAELKAIRRFLLASTERHNRSAATLRALPPVRSAL